MIIIIAITLCSFLFLLLLNSRYILGNSNNLFTVKRNLPRANIDWFVSLIPSFIENFIEANLIYTKSCKQSVYNDLFHALLVSVVTLAAFFVTLKSYFLLLTLASPFVVLIDFNFKVKSGKKNFIDSLDHLVLCLEILTVKSETPLSNVLSIISNTLPSDFYVACNEINMILQKADKFGLEKTLRELNRDSVEEQEFISILTAIQNGTNKNALKKNLYDFLLRQKSIKEERRKLFVENMQLYLMLPGTVMLLIAMYPLIDMILFQLQGVLAD